MNAVPYSNLVGGRDVQAVVAETPARLARVLDALTAEQVEARPAPEKWNVREVVAHLADCEIAWGWRLRQAYAGEHEIQPFDQDAWARMYGSGVYRLAAARATFDALRGWNVAFVSGLGARDRERIYTHPERGEERLWTLVEIMAGHDLHHLLRLEKLVAV